MTEKDIEKLEFVMNSVLDGNACTFDKNKVLEALKSILKPKCAVCRQDITADLVIINAKKLHNRCKKRYKPQ